MPVQLTLLLADTSSADLLVGYGAGAVIHVQSDTDADFGAPNDVTEVAIVSGTERYEVWDPDGVSATWYRTRYENAADTLSSDWSDGFQGGEAKAYAGIESLRGYLDLPDDSRDELLEELLVQASERITDLCGRDFYRHPVSGTEERVFRGNGWDFLDADIVSLTKVETRASQSGSYTETGTDFWALGPPNRRSGFPYERLYLVGTVFPSGHNTVRLTGVFGWASVPSTVVKATLDLARDWYRQGPGGGGPIGVTGSGTPIFAQTMPRSVTEALGAYMQRNIG